ncbi:MAG: hypothetical protein JG759_690 [Thermoanaerobacter sp.]|jgi:rhamnosyltransferase|nr:hypothetical protein [Thermoanaerobacter sp.]
MTNVSAGIVLYNPDISRLRENINAILPQVDFIVLVDNASQNIKKVESMYCNFDNIFFIKNKKNLGVATALNQIVKFCETKNVKWVLTLDQDSVVSHNLIENYVKYISYDRVAIITPKIMYRNDSQNQSILVKKSEPQYEYVEKCITSGSFINIPICKEIGYFDDKMFIDLVDFEYCIRIQKANYKILRLNNVALNHQLGDLKIYNFFGKKIFVTNHSELRYYYYARNSLYYLKKHKNYLSKKTFI